MSQLSTDLHTTLPARVHPWTVQSYGLSEKGRVRATNEDHFVIAQLIKSLRIHQSSLPQPKTQSGDDQSFLFLVADGMGGHQAGEEASALAVRTIEDFLLNTFKWFFHLKGPEKESVLHEFQKALRHTDVEVYDRAMHDPELHGMGTTLTLAYVLNRDLFIAHVGDSRCYLLRGHDFTRLTEDHTLVADMVRHGALTEDEAASHHLRRVITNAVGGNQPGVRVEVNKIALEAHDCLLLCTDGLTEMIADERIKAILETETAVNKACERLVTEASEAGGKDNITVIVTRFED